MILRRFLAEVTEPSLFFVFFGFTCLCFAFLYVQYAYLFLGMSQHVLFVLFFKCLAVKPLPPLK